MRRRAPRRVDAGFTLLELLLALSLLSLLIAALMGGLQLGRKVFDAGRANQAAGDLEAAATALTNLLARAYPAVTVDANKGQKPVFVGRPDSCFFVSLSNGDTQQGGLLFTEIGLEPGNAGADLTVWSAVYRDAAVASITRDSMRETEAARNVSYLNLSYFGMLEDGKPPRWSDSWINVSRLPLLISVRFGATRFGRPIDVSFNVALRQQAQQP